MSKSNPTSKIVCDYLPTGQRLVAPPDINYAEFEHMRNRPAKRRQGLARDEEPLINAESPNDANGGEEWYKQELLALMGDYSGDAEGLCAAIIRLNDIFYDTSGQRHPAELEALGHDDDDPDDDERRRRNEAQIPRVMAGDHTSRRSEVVNAAMARLKLLG